MKYRISEALVVKVKKQCNNNYPTYSQLAKIVEGGERMQDFKSRAKGCERTLDKTIGFVCLEGGEIERRWNGSKL